MKDFLDIIILESKALIQGFLVVFLLTFPFMFLPTIIPSGLKYYSIINRIPEAVQYSAIFAAFTVFAAVMHNYNSLANKKRLFDFPAFKALDFYGRIEGHNSIVKELSTFLLGKAGHYFFRICIVDPELKKFKIQITPLIYFGNNHELKAILKKELKLKEDLFLYKQLILDDYELMNPEFLKKELLDLSEKLVNLEVTALQLDEKEL